MRLINADAFIMEQCNSCDGYCEKVDCDCLSCDKPYRCGVIQELKNAPTVSPDEVRGFGKWILVDGIDEQAMARVHYIYCSNCGRQGLETRRGNDCRSNYCPHCGAKMEVE